MTAAIRSAELLPAPVRSTAVKATAAAAHFTLVISNVPGPTTTRYWNGAKLESCYPASIPLDGQAMNITVIGYADTMQFGLVGCRRNVPHLQRLLGHLEESLSELEAAAG